MAIFLVRHGLSAGWWTSAVCKRVRTILVPFLLMSIITFILTFAEQFLCSRLFHTAEPTPFTVHKLLLVFGLDFTSYPMAMTLWYLRTLFLFVLCAAPLVWLMKRSLYVSWGIVVLLFALAMFIHPTHSFFDATFRFQGLCFFALGLHLGLYDLHIVMPSRVWQVIVGLFVMILAGATFWQIENYLWLVEPRIVLMMVGLWLVMPSRVFPTFCVGNAFALYLLHALLLHFFYDGVRHISFVQASVETCLGYWLTGFGVILVTLLLATGIRLVLPRFSRVLFGGR